MKLPYQEAVARLTLITLATLLLFIHEQAYPEKSCAVSAFRFSKAVAVVHCFQFAIHSYLPLCKVVHCFQLVIYSYLPLGKVVHCFVLVIHTYLRLSNTYLFIIARNSNFNINCHLVSPSIFVRNIYINSIQRLSLYLNISNIIRTCCLRLVYQH